MEAQAKMAEGARKRRKLPQVPFNERLAYSVDEVAMATGVAPSTAWQYVRDGALKVTKIGRRTLVLRNDLDAFLAREAA